MNDRQRTTGNVWSLGWVSFFTDLSTEMIYPLLPLFLTQSLGATKAFVGLVEGAAESLSSVLKLASGWAADRSGRLKPMILIGYGLSTLSKPLIAVAAMPWHVLAVRLSDRIGKGVRTAPRDSLLAGSVPDDRRGWAFGIQRSLDHAGAIAGPLIAAGFLALFHQNYRLLFALAVVPGLFSLLLILFFVREIPAPVKEEKEPLRISIAPFDRNFRLYLASVLLFTLGNASDAFLLLRARDFGVAVAWIPILWVALHGVKMASSLPAGVLSDRVGRKRLIAAGWLIYAGVYAGFAIGSTPVHAWALFLIYGLYFGCTEGVEKAFIVDLIDPAVRGRAFGMFHFTVGLCALPASLLMGQLWTRFGAPTAFLTSGGLAFLAVFLMTTAVREPRTVPPASGETASHG